jgi:hypothetical protein
MSRIPGILWSAKDGWDHPATGDVGPGAGASLFIITADDRYLILPVAGTELLPPTGKSAALSRHTWKAVIPHRPRHRPLSPVIPASQKISKM